MKWIKDNQYIILYWHYLPIFKQGMFSLNKILNFESRSKCSLKQHLHKEDFCFVLLLEAWSEVVVEDAMFILSYILSFWAI